MKFKLDENLPAELAEDLRQLGHDAATVIDEGLGGAENATIVAAANAENRVLLTLDKGIANPPGLPSRRSIGSSFCSALTKPAAVTF